MTNEIIFETPAEFCAHIHKNATTVLSDKSLIQTWYLHGKVFYDPNVCSCGKVSRTIVEQKYKDIVYYAPKEKEFALRAVGGAFTLKFNGVVLGKVEYPE